MPCDLITHHSSLLLPLLELNTYRRRSFLLFALVKVLALIFQIFHIFLIKLPAADYILVQNPPSIPTLLIVWVFGALRRSIIIVDWHNLGFSIIAHSKGPRHPIVKVRARAKQAPHKALLTYLPPVCAAASLGGSSL